MKVCLVSSCWVPLPPKYGGIEGQVYGLSRALTEYCEEVHVITIPSKEIWRPVYENLKIHTIKLPKEEPATSGDINLAISELLFSYSASKIVKKLHIDVVHHNKPYPCLLGLKGSKGIPAIYHIENWKPIEQPCPPLGPGKRILVYGIGAFVDNLCVKHVDKVITISNFMKKGIITTTHINERKVTVIPNSVDTKMFHKTLRNDTDRDNSVLFVGRLVPEKGLEYLIRAMPTVLREVSDARLILVGPSKMGASFADSRWLRYYIGGLVHSLDLDGHVEFKGIMSMDKLKYLYSKVGVFVLPSVWQEPFGITLIEAMACETPVVAARVGGIPEVFKDGREGLIINPRNVKQLAEAVVRVLTNKKMARTMGRKGRRLVKRRYSWSVNAKKFYKVYEEAMEGC